MNHEFLAHVRKNGDEQKLLDHLNEVGELASIFAEKINVGNAGRLIGLLHDFGKFSQQFQAYLKSATGLVNPDEDDYIEFSEMKGKIDHSTAGAQLIWQKLHAWGKPGHLVSQILSLCIASHHSGLINCLDPDGTNTFLKRMEKPDDKSYYSECLQNMPKALRDQIECCINKQFMADIVGQLEKFKFGHDNSPHSFLILAFNLGFFTRFLFSCLIDADRINSADFEVPENANHRVNKAPDWRIAIIRAENYFYGLKGDKPIDVIRREISNNCLRRASDETGVYSLTVPTGGGKTYASLRFALHHAEKHKLDRIIYIIPYTSIIEQNAEAIRKIVEHETDDRPWVLEHHSNLEPEQQTWHSKLVSDNWDSPIVLTTMVQFLEVLFAGGTRGARRMHQLANSILIFDEIQTLPVNCTHLFCNAINYLTDHCYSTAVMCTATQPLLNALKAPEKGQLNIPDGNELVTNVAKLFESLKRVRLDSKIKPGGWSVEEISVLVFAEYHQKGNCLVIVNTKDWAANLYQKLLPRIRAGELFYLSTNLCPRHRKAMLTRIKRRLDKGWPVLCVSTQLIEAGVDIDFASVIRFLAGLDSIAQASGRCNRNGLRENSVVYIVNPKDENINMLTDIKIGREKAMRVLDEGFTDLLAPEAIRQYFNYYFFDRVDEMAYPVSKNIVGRDDNLLNLLSLNDKNGGRNTAGIRDLLKQSFMTAGKAFKTIDSPTQGVIVPYGPRGRKLINELCSVAKEFDSRRYRRLLRRAQRYSVNVFPGTWKKLVDQNAVHEIRHGEGIYFLDERYYSKEFGLGTEPCNLMSVCII